MDGEVFYLRLAEEPGECRDGEVAVHRLLQANGVVVPPILRWETAPPELDRSATLTAAISGQALANARFRSPALRDAVLREAGRALARINRIPVRGFGWVDTWDEVDGVLVAEHRHRSRWTEETGRAAEEVLGVDLFDRRQTAALARAIDRWLAIDDGVTGGLAHGDFDATHIYVTDDGIYAGIIDFGEIRGADPLYDLGYVHFEDQHPGVPQPLLPGILNGYRQIMPLPADAMAQIRDQAIAIGVRRLAIARRRGSPWEEGRDRIGLLLA